MKAPPTFALFLIITTLVSGCSGLISDLTGGPDRSCSASRHGFCFDASVAGVPVTEISSSSQRDLNLYRADQYIDSETFWEVRLAPGTPLAVAAAPNSSGQEWLGAPTHVSLVVQPLNNQKLSGEQRLMTSSNVTAGGKALVTSATLLKSNVLPRGDYIVSMTMNGPKNWDRKKVLVRIG